MGRKSSHSKLARGHASLPAPRTEIQARFVEQFEKVVGRRARPLLAETLRTTRRTEVPTDARELLTFVRANLTSAIIEAVGARGVGDFLTELERDAVEIESGIRVRRAASSRTPSRRPRIAVVESDPEARARLAAVLTDFGFEVEAIDDVRALTMVDPAPDAIVIDLSESTVGPLLFSLSSFRPERDPVVVVRTARKRIDIVRLLHAARLPDCEIVARDAPDSELVSVLAPLRGPRKA